MDEPADHGWPDPTDLVTPDDQRSHRERRDAGDAFWGAAPELLRDQSRAQELLAQYPEAFAQGWDAGTEVLQQLLGTYNGDAYLVPGFKVTYGYNVHIGSGSFVNMDCILIDDAPIRIGSDTVLAPRVQVLTGTHPLDYRLRQKRICLSAPVTIGDDVWIGAGAIILPGVTIGDRSVIGAGSVVTKDIPSDVLAVGNPCRVLRPVTEADRA